jgi:hypothetical protein
MSVSGVRSALDELRIEDLSALTNEELEDDFGELQRAACSLEAERLRRLAEIHRRASFRRDGFLSTSSWLAVRFNVGSSAASDQVRVARALEEMPATRQALADGEVSTQAVRALVVAKEAHPERFATDEEVLLGSARTLSLRQLWFAVGYWRQAADPERALEDQEEQRERRELHVSPTLEGMVRVDGNLDSETGESLISALRATLDASVRATGPPDLRTPAQRRADALGEICRHWLDTARRPMVAGERPHVTVTMDLDALKGRCGGTSELDHTGPIHPETARRLACDASVSRIITRGRSEPLDVGRRTAVVPAALRRAVVARDGGCRFPGCDRPHAWCDAHHIVHWADGGRTALPNLLLLCRPHHRLLHGTGGFRVELANGSPLFRRSDGSILEDRAPP